MRKLVILVCTVISMHVFAQSEVVTPIINADNSVIFSCPDSSYSKVYLKTSFYDEPVKMEKKDSVWIYKTDPMISDMYTYTFMIDDDEDGREVKDPYNNLLVRDIDEMFNYFMIDGYPANIYQKQNVAHGTIEKVWYPSSFSSNMSQRRMVVYFPPSYKQSTSTKFPVLYLLHGTGGDETSWCTIGRLAEIMDNMIAQKKCKPMIVVMPNGIEELDAAPGESPYMKGTAKHANVSSWMGRTETAFPNEVKKYVEEHYRVLLGKENTAIAGVSMGGMHAIAISMNNPEFFDYVGLFSPQTISGLTNHNIKMIKGTTKVIKKIIDKIPTPKSWREKFEAGAERVSNVDEYLHPKEKIKKQFENPPLLYYIAIGRDDGLKTYLDNMRDFMDDNKLKYTYNESSGGHTWENWRRYLIEFLPKLFIK